MELILEPMGPAAVAAIRSWRYPPPYDFYDLDADPEDEAEFMDPTNWPGSYFAAFGPDRELVGFFVYKVEAQTATIGLGMCPDLTGRGLGTEFVAAGLEYGALHLGIGRYILEVATFNQRAINIYRRLRFRAEAEFEQFTNGGLHPFVRMSGPAVRRGACVLMVDAQDRVALQLRDAKPWIGSGDCWSLFGGGMRPGETPEQTLVREMREELCIDIDATRLQLAERIVTPAGLRSSVYLYRLDDELAGARLQEGQRFGLYARHEIQDGQLEGKHVVPWHLAALAEFWAGAFAP